MRNYLKIWHKQDFFLHFGLQKWASEVQLGPAYSECFLPPFRGGCYNYKLYFLACPLVQAGIITNSW